MGNDESHPGSEPACLTVSIAQPAPKPEPGKPVYSCTVGSGSTWTKGSGEDLAFTFKRTAEGEEKDTAFAHFTSASMDGKELTRDQDYVATEGSVVITLKASYLEGLSTGEHTLTATFDDGAVDATLTVTDTSADNVTVAFDGNGASSGSMDKVVAARGSKLTLPANAFARDGYTFSGWNTAKDGSGTAYADKAELELTADTTLYAQWKQNPAPAPAPSGSTPGGNAKPTLPKTGDPASLAVVATLAAAGAGAVLAGRKRRK